MVVLALDSDRPGWDAAREWSAELRGHRYDVRVISAPAPTNDWNEALQISPGILHLAKSTFYKYVEESIILPQKIGHFLRFKREDILDYGKKNRGC
jgi:hypothetical protein